MSSEASGADCEPQQLGTDYPGGCGNVVPPKGLDHAKPSFYFFDFQYKGLKLGFGFSKAVSLAKSKRPRGI